MVNRLWAGHFGTGIVSTMDNFGKSGAPPTNQPLLDWLATELVSRGWSVKAIHRVIVTSTAYRQSSAALSKGLAVDPENKLLWRMSPRRLEAESIRDAMLAVSGRLALGAAALGLLTFFGSGGNRFTALNVTTWVGSVVLFLLACWQTPDGEQLRWPRRAEVEAALARLPAEAGRAQPSLAGRPR